MEYKLTFDDEDIRAAYLIADLALKAGGLSAYSAASRILAKMPAQTEEKQEEKADE